MLRAILDTEWRSVNKPLIATAYNNGVSGMDADEFERFYAQNGTNRVPEGWLAQIDDARISGIPNLNGHINPIDVHDNDFVGDGIAVRMK